MLEQFQNCCPLVKEQAIKSLLTGQFSRRQQCRELPKLATYINDPDLRVSAAACNAIRQLFTNLDPDSQIKYLPDVLPVLDGVVRDYQKSGLVRELAAAAMIIICMNHPDKTSSLLGPTVAALLEAKASSRSWLETTKNISIIHTYLATLPGGHVDLDYINQDEIDRHQTTISASMLPLIHFKKKLPEKTWAEIQSSLSGKQLDEFLLISDSICQTLSIIIFS